MQKIQDCEFVSLHVRVSNRAALGLYRDRLGYSVPSILYYRSIKHRWGTTQMGKTLTTCENISRRRTNQQPSDATTNKYILMDYKNLWSCEHSRPRRPSLAPWENEEEGWESEQFVIKARESPRSKSCVQHLQSSSKKRVAVDIGKTPMHNFSVKRNRQTRDKKKRTRYQIKINSISQTVSQDVP